MANKEVAETQSPNISEIAAALTTLEADRFLLLETKDEPFSREDLGRKFGIQTGSVYIATSAFRDNGLLIEKRGEKGEGSGMGPTVCYILSENNKAVRGLLLERGDLSSQLSPEAPAVSLTPAQKDFFLLLDQQKHTAREIAQAHRMIYHKAYVILTKLVACGLMEPPEKLVIDGRVTKQNLYILSERGIKYQEFLREHSDGEETVVDRLRKAEACVKGEKHLLHRRVIATVRKVFQERAQEIGGEEEVGERGLCLCTHITELMSVEDEMGSYSEINQKVLAAIKALDRDGILKTKNYDTAEHRDMPLYGKADTTPSLLKKMLVISIVKEMHNLILRVCAGEYGGLREPKKKKVNRETSMTDRLDELLARSVRVDQPHETEEISSGASKILAFLQKKESGAFPRKALVRDFGGGAMGEIQELEDAGLVEVGVGGIVKKK